MPGPWEDYTPPSDVANMVTSEAQRQGVDPALALRVATQESGLHHGAVSPTGAIGVMQLEPRTANGLGVDPTDLAQNIRGGVTYLKQQLDTFGGDPRLAAAAYNAGPGAVQKHGGVPPYPETQRYVDAVAPAAPNAETPPWSDYAPTPTIPQEAPLQTAPQGAEPAAAGSSPVVVNAVTGKPYNDAQQGAYAALIKSGTLDPQAKPGTEAFPKGLTDASDTPGAGEWYIDLQGNKRQVPSIGSDALTGLEQPFVKLGHDVMQDYRGKIARPLPSSIGDAAVQSAKDIGANFGELGDLLGVSGAPLSAVSRPMARAVNSVVGTPYAPSQLDVQNGALSVTAPRKLGADEGLDATQGMIGMALSALRPKAPVASVAAGVSEPMTLDAMQAAKKAAYAKVDASGFAFPQKDVQDLANDIVSTVAAKGGPSGAKLYPDATAMGDRLTAIAQQPDGVPLTQLDSLRGDIYDALVAPGGKEAPLGKMMRQKIDGLIDGSGAPDIQDARDLNTRYSKMKAVSDKLDSAGLRSASTYSGGNFPNAVRQSLRPLVDPTSAQQIGNLTAPESAALRAAVTGTPAQNATRYLSKFLTNKFVQVPASLMTHGVATPVMEAGGAILNKMGESQTEKAVQRVLDLMSMGGKSAASAPVYPTLALGGRPALPIWSPAGLIGASATAQQIPRIASALQGSPSY